MLFQTILQGVGLGALLVWVCAIGIRKGAVGMVHLYSAEVQARCVSLGLATNKSIRRNAAVMNLIDRFLIDGLWVGYTKAWIIPGTEDLMPYITKADKRRKWLAGTVGMALIAVMLAGIGTLLQYKEEAVPSCGVSGCLVGLGVCGGLSSAISA